MKTYSTLLDAINGLKKEGYTEDFNLKQESIEYKKGNYQIFKNEFKMTSVNEEEIYDEEF